MTPHQAVISWLISLLTSMTLTPKSLDARAAMEQARREVGAEVAQVAYDPSEPPLYKGPDGRAKTAALLGVIASLESRLASHVRAGQCLSHECDPNANGGHDATGLMQIHVGPGGILMTSLGYRRCSPREASCLHESDLLRREDVAIRLALHMIRQNGLASYCGEPVEGDVTKLRRDEAKKFLAAHPTPVLDESVLAESETASATKGPARDLQ